MLMTGMVLTMALTQIKAFPALRKQLGLMCIGLIASFGSSFSILAYLAVKAPTAIDSTLWLAAVLLGMFLVALIGPVVSILMGDLVDLLGVGALMSFSSAAEQAGRIIAPLALGVIYENSCDGAIYAWSAAQFVAGGLLGVFAWLSAPLLQKPLPQSFKDLIMC